MRMRTSALSVLAAAAAAVLPACPASGQEARAGLVARLTTLDLRGGVLHAPRSEVPFRLSLRISDAATGGAPSRLRLAAWIRPVAERNASCEDTARSLRATRGTPRGLTDLNGELIAVLNDDGSFGVVDRRLDQGGANMIAAAAFERRPDAMALDAAGMRALFVFGREGRIEEVGLLTGDRRTVMEGLHAPSGLRAAGDGHLWIAEDGEDRLLRVGPDGRIEARLRLPSGAASNGARAGSALFLRDTGSPGLVGVFSSDGRLALLDDWTGALRWNVSGPPVADAAFIGEEAVATLPQGGKAIELRYTDDPGHVIRIPVGIDARRLAVSETGRHAVAYTPGSPLFAIADLAAAQLMEAGHMRNEVAVQEAAFIGRNLYLLSENGGYVGIFETAALGRKDRSAPRLVGLASGQSRSGDAGTRIVPFGPSRALVVDRAGRIGLVLHDAMAIGNVPPEDYVRLRSGVPLSVAIVDRGLREVAPGRFETVARVSGGGPHELVLTTGVSRLTTCIRFEVEGDLPAESHVYTLSAVARDGVYNAGQDETVDFEFRDADGVEIPVARASFLVSSLQSSWALEIEAERNGDNRLRAQLRFPHAGTFSISPLGVPPSFELREPVLTQVLP